MYKVDTEHQFVTQNINGMTNVIKEIHWYYEYTCEDNIIHKLHGDPITLSDPDPSNFVEFSSLTEAEVNSWVELSLTSEEKEYYLDKLNQEISQWKQNCIEKGSNKIEQCISRQIFVSKPKVNLAAAPWN